MDINGINPYVAARIARFRADELAHDARNARRARLARLTRRAK